MRASGAPSEHSSTISRSPSILRSSDRLLDATSAHKEAKYAHVRRRWMPAALFPSSVLLILLPWSIGTPTCCAKANGIDRTCTAPSAGPSPSAQHQACPGGWVLLSRRRILARQGSESSRARRLGLPAEGISRTGGVATPGQPRAQAHAEGDVRDVEDGDEGCWGHSIQLEDVVEPRDTLPSGG